MKNEHWILLDTETTGFAAPIFVVELAAQRMLGWVSDGEPFRRLLNQNEDIPAEASRVHGYTREILERDGEPPLHVYREFTDYVGNLPLVSFNLQYDLEEVLKPEWQRLGVGSIGGPGFCALRLAQRLLDPVPAGNCKLQTLRQFYHLPERGAHTALGDVQTVADLFARVLRPIAKQRDLDSWDKLATYAAEEWYPSRIAFGKHKGRMVREAKTDAGLRAWLDWLASSSNPRTARMGRWYLSQLEIGEEQQTQSPVCSPTIAGAETIGGMPRDEVLGAAVILYVNPELEELRELVAAARARLAGLEAAYTTEKARVDVTQAILFRRLREQYQKRDRLRLLIDYRKRFLQSLLRGDDEEMSQAEQNYANAKAESDRDYEQAAAAVATKTHLSKEEEAELLRLWKKLVKLYHPDRFVGQPDKLQTFTKLTSAINRAKDAGDIATLREIAEDPHGFILRQGWASLDFGEDAELSKLRQLYESLQNEIISVLESLNRLRESPEFELCRISESRPGVLDELATEQTETLDKECGELETKARELGREIIELGGDTAPLTP